MNNKIIKILIPVIAVVVIFESVILVSKLEKNTKTTVVGDVTPTVAVEEPRVNSFDVSFSTDKTQMKIGSKYKILVKIMPKDNYNLDALDLYVRFDPEMVTVSNLVSSKSFGTPDLIKISDKKDVIAVNYLFTAKDGMLFTKDKEGTLLTFTVTPKVVGSSSFEISTGGGQGDSVTMFVDKNTSKDLLFTSSKLDVVFSK